MWFIIFIRLYTRRLNIDSDSYIRRYFAKFHTKYNNFDGRRRKTYHTFPNSANFLPLIMVLGKTYVGRIIYINKRTRCTFCMYSFYNLYTTLPVSKDHFVHHQQFMIYCILQLCANRAETCLTAWSYGWNRTELQNTVNHELLMMNEMVVRNR